jgi:hypothetical protein
MRFGASKYLGLALKDRSILAAEVHIAGNSRTVTHMAEFLFPAESSWDKPEALGTALRHFLRTNRFSASRAIFGVPAKWLMAREKDVPPATAEVAAAALRLQAERLFSIEARDLVCDYVGDSNAREARRVLVMAMLRARVDRIEKMADTAGVRALAVVPATLVLASAMAQSPATGSSLMLTQDAAELVIRDAGMPRMLKYLPVSGLTGNGENGSAAACLAALGTEVKRAVTLLPMASGPLQSLDIWDSIGLDPAQASSMGERTGLTVRRGGELSQLGISSSNGSGGGGGRFGAAVALGLAGAMPELRGIDFLHSRLAPARVHRIGRGTVWTTIIISAIVIGLGSLVYDVQRQKSALAGINASLSAIEPARQAAEEINNRVQAASGWYETRPPYLACLREITRAFPDEGSIWASNITLRETGKGTLTGHAVDERSVTTVVDRLKANRTAFTDIKQPDWRRGQDRTREIVFTLSFTFIGRE